MILALLLSNSHPAELEIRFSESEPEGDSNDDKLLSTEAEIADLNIMGNEASGGP